MLKIWKERRVYDSIFMGELEMIIEPTKPQTQEAKPAEFKVEEFVCSTLSLILFQAFISASLNLQCTPCMYM